MHVLVTGAFGNVGRSTIQALRSRGDRITILEADRPATRRLARNLAPDCRVVFGDVRDPAAAQAAMEDAEAVIHLAALIPPAADRLPELTVSVNVGGTKNLIRTAQERDRPPRFILASSVAAYGDRIDTPWISTRDPLAPNSDDVYGRTKVEAEALLRASGLPFCILRLSYIVWRKKLQRDPLMFHMPPGTKIEVCHTEDTGRAFAAAARVPEALGATFDIGGGEACRTTFREYLDRMFRLFGIGSSHFLPDTAFASSGFHCGWLKDSDEAERVLHFRGKTIEDYYTEVKEETRWLRPFSRIVAPAIRRSLLTASPFIRSLGRRMGGATA